METNGFPTLAETQKRFSADAFATAAGCTITSVEPERVVCEMPITPALYNANGMIMGGAIFTLADFAVAVGANIDGTVRVGAQCNIRYLSTAKGSRLIATCTRDRQGRRLGFYTVKIEDDTGRLVATYEAVLCNA